MLDYYVKKISARSGQANTDLSNLSTTGESHFANSDLSNLSSNGSDHFVTKDTDQTITGHKTFAAATYTKTGGTYSATPATDQTYAYVEAHDSANKKTANWGSYTNTNGTTLTYMNAFHPDDNTKVANVSVLVTSAGVAQTYATSPSSATANDSQVATTAWVRNHRCTTKATTTSSASVDKPAYVVENYRSGSNWYRVWSDGWIEQGGVWAGVAQNTSVARNLLKSFSTTDYSCILQPNTSSFANNAIHYVVSKTTTTTTISGYGTSNANLIWFACGY